MADEQLPTNFVAMYIRSHFKQLLALDHALCELVGGPPGFTLSGYAYEASTRGLRWALLWRPIIDTLAMAVWRQQDHCRLSYEEESAALQSSLAPSAYTK